MTIKLIDVVELTHPIEEYGLTAGATGTVVEVYNNGEAFEVEFLEDGRHIALLTLKPEDLRLYWSYPGNE